MMISAKFSKNPTNPHDNLKISPSSRRPQRKKVHRRLYANKPKCFEIVQNLHLNLDNKLENLQPNLESVEEKWASFRDADHSATLETVGPATSHHLDTEVLGHSPEAGSCTSGLTCFVILFCRRKAPRCCDAV